MLRLFISIVFQCIVWMFKVEYSSFSSIIQVQTEMRTNMQLQLSICRTNSEWNTVAFQSTNLCTIFINSTILYRHKPTSISNPSFSTTKLLLFGSNKIIVFLRQSNEDETWYCLSWHKGLFEINLSQDFYSFLTRKLRDIVLCHYSIIVW